MRKVPPLSLKKRHLPPGGEIEEELPHVAGMTIVQSFAFTPTLYPSPQVGGGIMDLPHINSAPVSHLGDITFEVCGRYSCLMLNDGGGCCKSR